MVTAHSVEEQLKKIGFNRFGWGRTEIGELPHILIPDEEIYECVNGIYEGGFALLVSTNIRVLLVDKKPMNYLTVEDLRFDMINEIDYSHRLLGAQIRIATGNRTLKFTSYNQSRLRKLINHVQHCMAELKKKENDHQEDQKGHLEQINQQLQTYLMAQHEQLQRAQLQQSGVLPTTPIRPSPELSDYLFAQSLLSQNQVTKYKADARALQLARSVQPPVPQELSASREAADLYNEGLQEVFGKRQNAQVHPPPTDTPTQSMASNALEINPLRIAYSKLPMALRNRKFGRPSFHAHSQQTEIVAQPTAIQY